MKTADPVLTPPTALGRGETIAITVLALAGLGGGVVAWRDLAVRRSDLAAEMQRRTEALEQARADASRLGRESEALLGRLKGILSSGPSAKAASAGAGADVSSGSGGPNALPAAARLAALGHLADLVQKGVLSTQTTVPVAGFGLAVRPGQSLPAYMVDANGKLAPGFGELFGLGETEVARFQAVITDLKQRTEEFVLNHTTVRPVENGYVLEYLPADGMAEVRDAGSANLKSILGDERYRIFAALNGERTGDNGTTTGGPGALFEAAGSVPRTLTLTRTPAGISYSLVSGTAGARVGSGSMGGGDVATLLTRLGPATRLLPQDFIDSIPRGAGGGGGGGGGALLGSRGAAPGKGQ
jgi:hypothetical protein